MTGPQRGGVATVIESDDPAIPVGATAVATSAAAATFAAGDGAQVVDAEARAALARSTAMLTREHGCTLLLAPVWPIPKLLVLGAGLDAIPLVGMAAELGWLVTVADHRPAYIERGGFDRAERALEVEPERLARDLKLAQFDAGVVMSHHLATDRKYLRELADVETRYLGVLGPRARRERLLADLADDAPRLRERLKGPVGLDIGADSPESIALSILAELHSTLSHR
jgi:xanthine/CO dehydrogenase XdhC/CoxF family maturation factor